MSGIRLGRHERALPPVAEPHLGSHLRSHLGSHHVSGHIINLVRRGGHVTRVLHVVWSNHVILVELLLRPHNRVVNRVVTVVQHLLRCELRVRVKTEVT